MSWAANLTVTKVTHKSDGTTEVTAQAELGEQFKVRYAHHSEDEFVETEGVTIFGEEGIKEVQVKFVIDGETHLEKGMVVNAHGHFDHVNTVTRVDETS